MFFFLILLTSILKKVLVWENSSVLTKNTASFCKFNTLAFCSDFLIDDVVPWSLKFDLQQAHGFAFQNKLKGLMMIMYHASKIEP